MLHPAVGTQEKPGSFGQHQSYCEQLLTQACDTTSRNIQTIAQWYYWACKTMAWKRGSAAINGWILTALFQADGHSLNLPSKAFRLLDEHAQTSLTFEDFMSGFMPIIGSALTTTHSTEPTAGRVDAAGPGPTAAAADSAHNNRSTGVKNKKI